MAKLWESVYAPRFELLEGHKPPKFEFYNGTGDQKVYLLYYDNL